VQILFVVRDGKIVESKEYHDMLHASLVIGP
jgi:ketosteroid isomerase-like protein